MRTLMQNYVAYFLAGTALAIVGIRALSDSARKDRESFARAVPGTARVLKLANSTPSRSYGAFVIDLLILVQRAGVEPYELSTMWSVEPGAVKNVQPGQTFAIKVDPLDAKRIFSAETWAKSLGVMKNPIQ